MGSAAAVHVVVLGLMGVGKTTLGRALAARLGVDYHDSDTEIERAHDRSGRELAAERGVRWLHQLEADVLEDLLTRDPPSVVSAAASVVDSPDSRQRLRDSAFCCWIQLPLDMIPARVGEESHRRAMPMTELRELAARRETLFAELADVTIDGRLPVQEQVAAVEAALPGRVPT